MPVKLNAVLVAKGVPLGTTVPDPPLIPGGGTVFLLILLNNHGVTATIRASRGQDIFAACGLLSTAKKENRNN